jgi:hypothetical protein
MMKKIVFLLSFVVVAFGAHAQTAPKVKSLGAPPKSVLLVGNSFFYFNDSMHRFVLGLLGAADAPLRAQTRMTSVTISGSGLNWHDIDAYLKPGSGMASYSFTADNKVVFNKFDKPFEAVIMNDCSQCPIHPQLKDAFHEFSKKHSQTTVKYGAKPILFMTWAYSDAPEMTAQLAEQYTIAGNANDALVIPAGLAFARSIAKNPALNLYNPDKRHPSLAGSYLGAATIYASLYGKSPAGLKYTGGLDEKTALFLQETAWEAVSLYYGK